MQRRMQRGEPRLPAAIAVLMAMALYALLPNQLLLGPRLVVPALEIILFVPLVVANPTRMTRQSRNLRRLAIALVLLIAFANAVALVLLVRQLVTGRASEGTTLLLAAGQVWMTNILVFSLAYWELERGGSVQRTHTPRPRLPAADPPARRRGERSPQAQWEAGAFHRGLRVRWRSSSARLPKREVSRLTRGTDGDIR